jgi:oxygen-independent coproporphyrinogen-3 oxidase
MVDREARAVGRLHTLETVVGDVARLRASGLENINVDLIAGLPHQTAASWKFSLGQILELAVPHVSVYMLEVDEDSRLGRELLAGGQRYHAHFVPDEDSVTEFYVKACDILNGAGVEQYEISNFVRSGAGSRHNLKYWTRQPYLGFGVDAHSMLKISPESSAAAEFESVRFSTPDSLDGFLSNQPMHRTGVSWKAACEEWFFLGLRLNCGVCLEEMPLGVDDAIHATVSELQADRLLERQGSRIFLTERGRLLSNEVFQRFLEAKEPIVA